MMSGLCLFTLTTKIFAGFLDGTVQTVKIAALSLSIDYCA